MSSSSRIIDGLGAIAGDYRAILCDLWGVLHNGADSFPEAAEALRRARAAGLAVVLLTNVPRPGSRLIDDLRRFAIDPDVADGVVTSGDVCRALIADSGCRKVLHIGKPRNLILFEGLDIAFVEEADAGLVVCTSLDDAGRHTPEDYRELLARLVGRGLRMICANPDRVAQQGDRLVYCAGSLADLYAGLGGDVVITGKPERPIYDRALAELARITGRRIEPSEVLAIGDGLVTDIAGAVGAGIDALLVTSGVHAAEFGEAARPDAGLVAKRLAGAGLSVRAAITRLRW
jgi:HAD superfamily hydrolase (TIGR01459 family)